MRATPTGGPPEPAPQPATKADRPDGFAELLESHKAWTAQTEGRDTKREAARTASRDAARTAREAAKAARDARESADAADSATGAAGNRDVAIAVANVDATAPAPRTDAPSADAASADGSAPAPTGTSGSDGTRGSDAAAAASTAIPAVAAQVAAPPAEAATAQMPVPADGSAAMQMLTAADPAVVAQVPGPRDSAAAAQVPAGGDPAAGVQMPASADAADVAQMSTSADASGAGGVADPEASASEPPAGQGAAHANPPDHAVARGLAEHGAPEQAVAKGLDNQDPSPIAPRENGAEASRLPKPPTAATPDTQAPTQHADRNVPTPVAPASAPIAARPEAMGLHRTGFVPVVQPVAATIHVLTSRGAVHARLHLHPEELGGVEIALRTTADGGVSARLVADNPHAARVLSERLHDLTSALARQGIALTDVEVRTAHDGASRDGRPAGHAAHGRRRAEGTDSVDDVAAPATTQTIVLDGGSIVDVLA